MILIRSLNVGGVGSTMSAGEKVGPLSGSSTGCVGCKLPHLFLHMGEHLYRVLKGEAVLRLFTAFVCFQFVDNKISSQERKKYLIYLA